MDALNVLELIGGGALLQYCYQLDSCCSLVMLLQDVNDGIFAPVVKCWLMLHQILEGKVRSEEKGGQPDIHMAGRVTTRGHLELDADSGLTHQISLFV
eukprot:10922475-Ditylum_brightwellii.AAC.1